MTGSEHSADQARDQGLPLRRPAGRRPGQTAPAPVRPTGRAGPAGRACEVVWPYEQRCPIHGPRDRDTSGASSRALAGRQTGVDTSGTRAGDEPSPSQISAGSSRPSSTPCSARTPRSPDGSTPPNSDCSARTIGSGGVFTPTASPPSTARTPPRSTSRSPSTAPKCSARPTRSQRSSRSTGKSTAPSSPTKTVAEERRQLAAEIGELIRQLVRCAGRRRLDRGAGPQHQRPRTRNQQSATQGGTEDGNNTRTAVRDGRRPPRPGDGGACPGKPRPPASSIAHALDARPLRSRVASRRPRS